MNYFWFSIKQAGLLFQQFVLGIGLFCLANAAYSVPQTFVVNKNTDTTPNGCTAADCTLREAILAANGNANPADVDSINFSFSTIFARGADLGEVVISDPNDPNAVVTTVTFQPTSVYPTITQAVSINGYSVTGSAANTDPNISNARIRLVLNGTNAGSNSDGLHVCSNNVTISGLSIVSFDGDGIQFGDNVTCNINLTGVRALGNLIGISPVNTAAGNGSEGISSVDAITTIGTTNDADRNVIGSNGRFGIFLFGAGSSNSSVLNNLIGTEKTGTLDRGNAARGVEIGAGAATVTVGNIIAPNKIAFNNIGVSVHDTLNNRINLNHYGPNDALGIDLKNAALNLGVSLNDAGDADGGGNGQQNYLNDAGLTATRTPTGINIQGTLQRIASTTVVFTITAYSTTTCDSSLHGEGEILLGTATESTTAGNAPINVDIALATQPVFGSFITTTVTSPSGSTSEFSVCAPLDPPALVVNSTNDVVDANGCNATHCSLREAINASNAAPAPDVIQFNITSPASGELLIQPLTNLPTITQPVLIDGYSQSGTSVNTDADISNAVLRIRINGSSAGTGGTGLSVCANNVTLQGLSITNFATRGIAFGIQNNGSLCSGEIFFGKALGNFLGLASDGATAAGNLNDGIVVFRASIDIGSADRKDRNVIGANTDSGVDSVNEQPGVVNVLGNLIGTDKSGALARGNGSGVEFGASVTNFVVGSAAAPNLIRFNNAGITAFSTAGINNQFAQNKIFDNVTLGIDLNSDSVTLNDLNDADTGPNGLQNFPVITRAERTDTGILIAGSLDIGGFSVRSFDIAVYANTACDSPSGHGEGERYLGTVTVNLRNPTGESFVFNLVTDDPLEAGVQITTTATGNEGTSEFSACIGATDPAPGIAVDSNLDIGATALGCDTVGDANECTLREAIALANSQAGADLIRFEIPGNGPHDIAISSLLPSIDQALTIDGYTQAGAAPNAAELGSDAVIKIQLRDAASVIFGLMTCSSDVTIRGLSIAGFASGAIATQMNANSSCAVVGNNVKIVGNFINVFADGSSLSGGAAGAGISVNNTPAQIGGADLADRNVFAGSLAFGLRIAGTASANTTVQNNLFGITPDLSTATPNGTRDIEIAGANDVVIGGEGDLVNRFRFGVNAILGTQTGTGNTFYANEIANYQGATAIDLSTAATANGIDVVDVNDDDAGPNNLQNAPVLSDGTASSNTLTINGVMFVPASITAPTPYIIAFYESTSCNDNSGSSNNGREGQIYLGAQTVSVSNTAENFTTSISFPAAPGATFITATATAPDGSTSEFSNCLTTPRADGLFADSFED